MLPYVIQVDGGIGRVICAIPAIEKLADSRKIIIITSFPDVFWHNPNVYKVYRLGNDYLWDDVIRHGEFLYPEPYHDHNFYNQKQHLIQSFYYLLVGSDEFKLPSLYLSEEESLWAERFILERRKEAAGRPIVMFQPFGSGIISDTLKDPSHRSLPKNVVDDICNSTDCFYINASHIPLCYPNVWQQEFNLRQLFSLTKYCDFIVSVDSFLMHAAAAFDKRGITIFGGTFTTNLGYLGNFKTIQKVGYPRSYTPNRFHGFVDDNQDAMDLGLDEIDQIITAINSKDFPT